MMFASAQSSQVNGTIRGVISDSSGGLVANASVKATGTDTGFERATTSNERGEYEVPLLPITTYDLAITAPGFSTYEQKGIQVRLDNASEVNVALQISSTQQTISVESDASILTTQSFAVGGPMNQRSLENMPITSRNSFNLALFAPDYNGTSLPPSTSIFRSVFYAGTVDRWTWRM